MHVGPRNKEFPTFSDAQFFYSDCRGPIRLPATFSIFLNVLEWTWGNSGESLIFRPNVHFDGEFENIQNVPLNFYKLQPKWILPTKSVKFTFNVKKISILQKILFYIIFPVQFSQNHSKCKKFKYFSLKVSVAIK